MSNKHDDAEYKFRWDPIGLSDYYLAILKENPDDEEAFGRVSSIYSECGYHQAIKKMATEFLERNPLSHRAWFSLGVACSNLREEENSLKAFEKAAEYHPSSAHTWRAVAQRAARTRDYAKAREAYQKLDKMGELTAKDANERARLLFEEKNFAEAYDAFKEIIEPDGKEASVWLALSICAQKLDRPADAQAAKKKALELRPDDAYWSYESACSLSDTGNLLLSEHMVRQAIEIAPNAWHLHSSLANILKLQGRDVDAKVEETLANSLRPKQT